MGALVDAIKQKKTYPIIAGIAAETKDKNELNRALWEATCNADNLQLESDPATRKQLELQNLVLVQDLLDRGADKDYCPPKAPGSMIYWAAHCGYFSTVVLFLTRGCSTDRFFIKHGGDVSKPITFSDTRINAFIKALHRLSLYSNIEKPGKDSQQWQRIANILTMELEKDLSEVLSTLLGISVISATTAAIFSKKTPTSTERKVETTSAVSVIQEDAEPDEDSDEDELTSHHVDLRLEQTPSTAGKRTSIRAIAPTASLETKAEIKTDVTLAAAPTLTSLQASEKIIAAIESISIDAITPYFLIKKLSINEKLLQSKELAEAIIRASIFHGKNTHLRPALQRVLEVLAMQHNATAVQHLYNAFSGYSTTQVDQNKNFKIAYLSALFNLDGRGVSGVGAHLLAKCFAEGYGVKTSPLEAIFWSMESMFGLYYVPDENRNYQDTDWILYFIGSIWHKDSTPVTPQIYLVWYVEALIYRFGCKNEANPHTRHLSLEPSAYMLEHCEKLLNQHIPHEVYRTFTKLHLAYLLAKREQNATLPNFQPVLDADTLTPEMLFIKQIAKIYQIEFEVQQALKNNNFKSLQKRLEALLNDESFDCNPASYITDMLLHLFMQLKAEKLPEDILDLVNLIAAKFCKKTAQQDADRVTQRSLLVVAQNYIDATKKSIDLARNIELEIQALLTENMLATNPEELLEVAPNLQIAMLASLRHVVLHVYAMQNLKFDLQLNQEFLAKLIALYNNLAKDDPTQNKSRQCCAIALGELTRQQRESKNVQQVNYNLDEKSIMVDLKAAITEQNDPHALLIYLELNRSKLTPDEISLLAHQYLGAVKFFLQAKLPQTPAVQPVLRLLHAGNFPEPLPPSYLEALGVTLCNDYMLDLLQEEKHQEFDKELMLRLDSGIEFLTTQFAWPKDNAALDQQQLASLKVRVNLLMLLLQAAKLRGLNSTQNGDEHYLRLRHKAVKALNTIRNHAKTPADLKASILDTVKKDTENRHEEKENTRYAQAIRDITSKEPTKIAVAVATFEDIFRNGRDTKLKVKSLEHLLARHKANSKRPDIFVYWLIKAVVTFKQKWTDPNGFKLLVKDKKYQELANFLNWMTAERTFDYRKDEKDSNQQKFLVKASAKTNFQSVGDADAVVQAALQHYKGCKSSSWKKLREKVLAIITQNQTKTELRVDMTKPKPSISVPAKSASAVSEVKRETIASATVADGWITQRTDDDTVGFHAAEEYEMDDMFPNNDNDDEYDTLVNFSSSSTVEKSKDSVSDALASSSSLDAVASSTPVVDSVLPSSGEDNADDPTFHEDEVAATPSSAASSNASTNDVHPPLLSSMQASTLVPVAVELPAQPASAQQVVATVGPNPIPSVNLNLPAYTG